MSKAASKDSLGVLHKLIATYFIDKFSEDKRDSLTSGDIQNVLRFLKDNAIEASVDVQSEAENVAISLENSLRNIGATDLSDLLEHGTKN